MRLTALLLSRIFNVDGSMQSQSENWEGGINALRRDIESISRDNREGYDKAIQNLKHDLNTDIGAFKKGRSDFDARGPGRRCDAIKKKLERRSTQARRQKGKRAVKAVKMVGRTGGGLLKQGGEE